MDVDYKLAIECEWGPASNETYWTLTDLLLYVGVFIVVLTLQLWIPIAYSPSLIYLPKEYHLLIPPIGITYS